MLSKQPRRTYIPGSPEIPFVPEHTVCAPPPPGPPPPPQGGSYQRVCVPITLPPGVAGDPFFCYDVWVPFNGG